MGNNEERKLTGRIISGNGLVVMDLDVGSIEILRNPMTEQERRSYLQRKREEDK